VTDGGGAAARPEAVFLMVAEDEDLSVRVQYEPGYVLITAAGEIDFASVAGLRERMYTLAATGRPLVADLDRVSFIDAAGLGALAVAASRAAAHGASLRVVCAQPRIRRLFRVTGLDQAVSLVGTLDEALCTLASAARAV